MEKTHNLEVPGSSPGWSTLKIKGLHQKRSSFFHVCVNKELLTEEDKRNLIYPETDMKNNRATCHSYSEMSPEFTFWNNPFRRRN